MDNAHFRFSSDILRRLGEELNPSVEHGIVELAKNAYDADATEFTVTLRNLEEPGGTLVITDNGDGMDVDDIKGGWLVIGQSRKSGVKRTGKGRIPAGYKGLGRLAALRLGQRATVVTRPKSHRNQHELTIDWKAFEKARLVEDVDLSITTVPRPPETEQGTEVRIENLRSLVSQAEVRRLARALILLADPFEDSETSFKPILIAPEFEEIAKLVKTRYLGEADYHLVATIDAKGRAKASVVDWKEKVLFKAGHKRLAVDREGATYGCPPAQFDWDLFERRAGFTKLKQAPKFGDFVEQFLKWSEQQHRPKTHELHAGNCKTLNRFFRSAWLDEVTQGMVEDFKLTRIKEKRWGERDEIAVSGVTVNRALSTLRLVYNFAERCGYTISNPVKHITFFREEGRTRIISPEEERAYFVATSQPLQDIARIILDTGMRPEEVFRIETANLDLGQRTIFNPFGKTAAAKRKLTMTDEIWSILKKRAIASKSPYAFSSPDKPEKPIGSVRKAHDAAIRRAKIAPGFRLYDLRHTYASRAVMAGVDLPTLAALLGHTSVHMTMRYVHPAEEHKREAAAKIERFKTESAIELATRSQGVTTKVTTVERVQ